MTNPQMRALAFCEQLLKKDGGPALPTRLDLGDNSSFFFPGISLRDLFAFGALVGICGDGIPGSHHRPDQTAEDAYRHADAMLAERAKHEELAKQSEATSC